MGSVDQRFAWNASANEAGASGSLAFNDDGFQAELGRANGGDVASGTCTDDKNLALFCFHPTHLT